MKLKDGTEPRDPRLGRVVHFDQRSLDFPVTADPRLSAELKSCTWRLARRFNQLQTPRCVGYSRAHDLAAEPKQIGNITEATADQLYDIAQDNDEWPGKDYEGSSVLGGAKAALALGYVGEYRWAGVDPNTKAIDDVLQALSSIGGGVHGIPWKDSMFDPRPDGTLDCTGEIAGGHAIYSRSILLPRNGKISGARTIGRKRMAFSFAASEPYIGLTQTWGADWGILGEAFISASDMEDLLHLDGESCITTVAFSRPRR